MSTAHEITPYPLLIEDVEMFIRITLSLYSIAFFNGCTQPEEEPVSSEPSTTVQDIETTDTSTNTSILDKAGKIPDYKSKYTYLPPEDERWIEFGIYRSPKPPTWSWIPPNTPIVKSSYVVPSIETGDSAAFTITHFELGEGGELAPNLKRWKLLFRTGWSVATDLSGGPVQPRIDSIIVNNRETTTIEMRGEYIGAGASWHLPDHTLLIVIVEDETGRFFFKLLGPTITIDAHREAFISVLTEMEPMIP